MKKIEIFKTEKKYIILTMYQLESGSFISSEPIYILPLHSEIEDFASFIIDALKLSRKLNESEENSYWLGKNLLKKMREPSFEKLYRESVSCQLNIENESLFIIPRKYLGKNKGLLPLENIAYKMEFEENNILNICVEILKILEIKYN